MLGDKQLAGVLVTGVGKARQVARWIWCGPRQALKKKGESESRGYHTMMGISDYCDTAGANAASCKLFSALDLLQYCGQTLFCSDILYFIF